MAHVSLKYLSAVLWLGACAFAWVRGGRPERIVAAALVADLLSVLLLQRLNTLSGPQYVILIGDVAVLGVLGRLAFVTDRRWLLWATGFQLTSVLTHIGEFVDVSARVWAVLTASWIWGYALITALVVGTAREGQAAEKSTPGRTGP